MVSSRLFQEVIASPSIDKETLDEILAWARVQFEHHKDGAWLQEENGAFYKLTASLSPVLRKRHSGHDYLIRAVAILGETFITIERRDGE